MVRSVAINIGANTNEPGFRGPIFPDGSFEFVPIPEHAQVRKSIPTYGELPISVEIPQSVQETPVHLDPTFKEYEPCKQYTYGDPYGVKARPLLSLQAGDRVYFYATLSTHGDGHEAWIVPEWGAYLIGEFVLLVDPIPGESFDAQPPDIKSILAENAHLKRAEFDARVLLIGDPEKSWLFDRAVPLSEPTGGTTANKIVTAYSSDSGKGPWWRRPLRFDTEGTKRLQSAIRDVHEADELR